MALVDDFLASKFGSTATAGATDSSGDPQKDIALSIIKKKYPRGTIEEVSPVEQVFGTTKKEKEVTNAQAPPNIDKVDYSAQALAKYILDNGIVDLQYKDWWNNSPVKSQAWNLILEARGQQGNYSPNYVADTVLSQGRIPPKYEEIRNLIGDVLDPNSYLHPGSTEREAADRHDQLKKMGELEVTSAEYAEELKQEGRGLESFVMETFAKQVGTLRYGISETAEGKIFTGIPAMVFGVTPQGLAFNAATSLPVIGEPIEEVFNFAFNAIPDAIIENTPGLNTAPQGFKDMVKLGIQLVEGVAIHKVVKDSKPIVEKGIKVVGEKILTKKVEYSKTEVFKALQEINGVPEVGANPKVVAQMRELITNAGEGVKQTQILRNSWRKGITVREARSFTDWFNKFFKDVKPENTTPTFAKLLTDGKKAITGKMSITKFAEEARGVMAPEIVSTVGAKRTVGNMAIEKVAAPNLVFGEKRPAIVVSEQIELAKKPLLKPTTALQTKAEVSKPVTPEITNKEIDKIVEELKRGDISEERYQEMTYELDIAKEALRAHPAASLSKYMLKSTGRLPEFSGLETRIIKKGGKEIVVKNNEFAKRGDKMAQELGFESTEAARNSFDDYVDLRDKVKEADAKLKDVRRTRKEIKATESKRYEEPVTPSKAEYTGEQAVVETRPEAVGTVPRTGVSRIAKSIRAKALEEKLLASVGEVAGYDKITIKEQAKLASDLINSDFEYARNIIKGEERIPTGLNPVALIKAMEDIAMSTRDGKLAAEIIKSPLITETSEAAQTLRLASERTPDSATAKMQEIQNARKEAAKRKTHGKSEKAVKDKMKKDLKAKQAKYKPTKRTWEALIDELTC